MVALAKTISFLQNRPLATTFIPILLLNTTLIHIVAFYRRFTFKNDHLNLHNCISLFLSFSASQPPKSYTNGSKYLIRRPFNPAETENAWLYDDTPTPCNRSGPLYHKCPVCHCSFLPSQLIILHSLNHVPHRACPRCLNFLLSRHYNKCPTCAQSHLYFRVPASAFPSPNSLKPLCTSFADPACSTSPSNFTSNFNHPS